MRLIKSIVILSSVWILASNPAMGDQCYETAERLKESLGIEGDYDPRLRVERKSTNTNTDARIFLEFIARVLRPNQGEVIELRDVSSDPNLVLVTSTNYPFSKDVLSRLNLKVRVREYGQRRKGTSDAFSSTTGDFVNLEIKAKLPIEGVVVKPILKIPKSILPDLFSTAARFAAARKELLRSIVESNPKIENAEVVVAEVLSTLAELHRLQAQVGAGPIPCENVEYQRNAYVMKVAGTDGNTRKVQLTFDRAVSLREAVDAGLAPEVHGRNVANAKYPPDAVVIEMKTDLWLNERFMADPAQVRQEFPSYYQVRSAYEQLQATTIDGFRADSGKAAHFRRNDISLEQFVHFLD